MDHQRLQWGQPTGDQEWVQPSHYPQNVPSSTLEVASSIPIVPHRRKAAAPQQPARHPDQPPQQNTESATGGDAAKRPKRKLKLTAAQRERKRAIDREAQRSIRVKTKNYIAHLENLVRVTEKNAETAGYAQGQGHGGQAPDPAAGEGDRRARELLAELRHSQNEVKKLRDTVSGIQRLIGGPREHQSDQVCLGARLDPPPTQHEYMGIMQGQEVPRAVFDNLPSRYPYSGTPCNHDPRRLGMSDVANFGLGLGHPMSTQETRVRTDTADSIPLGEFDLPELSLNVGEMTAKVVKGTLYYFSEASLRKALLPSSKRYTNQPMDEDIAVRAVLRGWQDVEDHYILDPGWLFLRDVDQHIYTGKGVVDRLAILRTMRIKFLDQAHELPSESSLLPSFFQPTHAESDATAAERPVAEHFVWPGFRISILNNPTRYICNRFAESFRRNLKFVWPFDITDAYTWDSAANLYAPTPELCARMNDLRSWTMRKSFFDDYVELLGAIPGYDPPVSRTLTSPAMTRWYSHQTALARHQHQHEQQTSQAAEEQEVDDGQRVHANEMSRYDATGQMTIASAMSASTSSTTTTTTTVSMPTSTSTSSSSPSTSSYPQPCQPHELESWLGDAEIVPQYWQPGMVLDVNGMYGAQWDPNIQYTHTF